MTRQQVRERIAVELAKPIDDPPHTESFDPWSEVIQGIYGNYASQSDALMIGALEAVRDRRHSEFMAKHGFAGEFMFYILAGHDMLEYGTSPRFGWPTTELADLWQPLIDKWREYYRVMWGEDYSP